MINLKEFCSKADPVFSDEDMREPFSLGEYTYATNGIYIIRVPLVEKYKDNQHCISPLNNIEFPTDKGEYVKTPVFRLPEQTTCNVCKGTGMVMPCQDCDTEGTVLFERGVHIYEVECKECYGNGYITGDLESCPYCEGEGFNYEFFNLEPVTINLNGQCLSKAMLMKLSKLPLFALRKYPTACKPEQSTHFVFCGGDGLLMHHLENEVSL